MSPREFSRWRDAFKCSKIIRTASSQLFSAAAINGVKANNVDSRLALILETTASSHMTSGLFNLAKSVHAVSPDSGASKSAAAPLFTRHSNACLRLAAPLSRVATYINGDNCNRSAEV